MGATLQNHYNPTATMAAIRTGRYPYVVLQGQSQEPVYNYADFADYAGKLDQAVRAAGGRSIIFMTWERPDSIGYGVTTAALADACTKLGQALQVKVAPAGLAFAQALSDRPGLALKVAGDGNGHETAAGSYLAACVLYALVYGTPVGNSYGAGLSDGDRAFLQQTAAKVTADYLKAKSWITAVRQPRARRAAYCASNQRCTARKRSSGTTMPSAKAPSTTCAARSRGV